MIPVNTPLFAGNERKYLLECIDTGWVSSEGPFVERFERAMADKCGRKHGIAVCNGTAALDIAVEALDLKPGDEVIVPTFTIISCVQQIVRASATPVLVDANPDTWTMDVDQIEAKISSRTRAIMVVHIYGLPTNMEPILDLCARYDLALIEDAAEAHGQHYRDTPCGGFGEMSTFSFYPNKHVTAGEGGMIVTDRDDLAAQCRSLRNLCFKPEARFEHDRLGWNYRITNMQAAIGLAQVERLAETVERKKRMGALYQELLEEVEGIRLPLPSTDYAENHYWVFGLVLENSGKTVQDIVTALADRKIGTRPFFHPMHMQPVLRKMGLFDNESYPVAENLRECGFYLPSGVALSDGQIEEVASAVKEILA